MGKRRGFTLTEICFVLAVLLIMAALLFPVLGRVREKSKQATCQSNLRQIYLGMVQYVADNDSRFPNVPMLEPMMLYIKDRRAFICPSVSVPSGYTRAVDDVDYEPIGNWMHTLAFVPSGNGLPKFKLTGLSEATIIEPAQLILIADHPLLDSTRAKVAFPRGAACGVTLSDGHPILEGSYATLHDGGMNAGFYDGHIKWITPQQAAGYECETGKFSQPPFRAGGPHVAD